MERIDYRENDGRKQCHVQGTTAECQRKGRELLASLKDRGMAEAGRASCDEGLHVLYKDAKGNRVMVYFLYSPAEREAVHPTPLSERRAAA